RGLLLRRSDPHGPRLRRARGGAGADRAAAAVASERGPACDGAATPLGLSCATEVDRSEETVMKSKAAIQVEPGGPLVVEEIDIPDPGPNQVTVRNFASGVCYSQVHQLRNPGLPRPMGLGHEGWLRRADRGRRGAAYGEGRAWPVGGCVRRWRRRLVGDWRRCYCRR